MSVATTLEPLARHYYRVREIAQILDVSHATVYRLVDSGELQAIRIRGAIRVPVLAFGEYLSRKAAALD